MKVGLLFIRVNYSSDLPCSGANAIQLKPHSVQVQTQFGSLNSTGFLFLFSHSGHLSKPFSFIQSIISWSPIIILLWFKWFAKCKIFFGIVYKYTFLPVALWIVKPSEKLVVPYFGFLETKSDATNKATEITLRAIRKARCQPLNMWIRSMVYHPMINKNRTTMPNKVLFIFPIIL